MAFFSWFKPKSGSPKDSEARSSSKPTAASEPGTTGQTVTASPGIPRLRETVPKTGRTLSGSPTFKRPIRATIDIPLQTLWQALPQGLAQNNASLDPKRRIQIPRKEVRVNDTDHTGTVSLYVVHAVCPEIFAAPILAIDNRTVHFPLPAWERLRTAEVLEVKTAPVPIAEPEKLQAEPQLGETPDSPVQAKTEVGADEKLSEKQHSTSMTNGHSTEVRANGVGFNQNVRVALSPILRNLPPELNQAALHDVAGSNSEIELPFDLIRPQLANGQVTVPILTFLEAVPETVRVAFGNVDQSAQVPIPLKEIFRHLPSNALPVRADQEVDELRDPIDTPFTATAREDAERFRKATSTVAESEKNSPQLEDSAQLELGDSGKSDNPEAATSPPEPTAPPAPEPVKSEALTKPELDFSSLQSVFLTDERLDLPIIIDKVSGLPGLQTALLHTADGRRLSGAIGDERFEHAVLTLFPALFSQAKTQLNEQECSGLETLTFCWHQEQVSVFSDGRLCLSVRHSRRPFKPGVREKLSLIFSRLTEVLSSSEI
jgi:hypothetical protein